MEEHDCICTPKCKPEISMEYCGDLVGYCDLLVVTDEHLEPGLSNNAYLSKSIELLERKRLIYTYKEPLRFPLPVVTTTTTTTTTTRTTVAASISNNTNNEFLENYSIVRVYVYLMSKKMGGQIPTITTLSHFDNRVTTALMELLPHLKHDWEKAWAGLLKPRNSNCRFCCGNGNMEKNHAVYSIKDIIKCKTTSKCYVLGCEKHQILNNFMTKKEKAVYRRNFSLLNRFNRLEPPPPVDLIGLTVGHGMVPLLN